MSALRARHFSGAERWRIDALGRSEMKQLDCVPLAAVALWAAMDALTALGLTAATFTTASFVPQLTKVVRTKSAADLSYGMFTAFSAGIALWLLYGLLRHDLPVIIANGVTLVLSLAILVLKSRYDR